MIYPNFEIEFKNKNKNEKGSFEFRATAAIKIALMNVDQLISQSTSLINNWTFWKFIDDTATTPEISSFLRTSKIGFKHFINNQYRYVMPINDYFGSISELRYKQEKKETLISLHDPDGTNAITSTNFSSDSRRYIENEGLIFTRYNPFSREKELSTIALYYINGINNLLYSITECVFEFDKKFKQKGNSKGDSFNKFFILKYLRNHFAHSNEIVQKKSKETYYNDKNLSEAIAWNSNFGSTTLVSVVDGDDGEQYEQPYSISFLMKYLEFTKEWTEYINNSLEDKNIYFEIVG